MTIVSDESMSLQQSPTPWIPSASCVDACALRISLSIPDFERLTHHLLPPVCSILSVDRKLVREARPCRDRALSDARWTVHPWSAVLEQSVPVDRGPVGARAGATANRDVEGGRFR